jgi:endonuclease YncB( thermonuclease family)
MKSDRSTAAFGSAADAQERREQRRAVVAAVFFAILVGCTPLRSVEAQSARLVGTVQRVVDGDTLEIAGQRIRLWGIDAPESGQSCQGAGGGAYQCGQAATSALSGLMATQTASCSIVDRDRYGRLVAACSVTASNGASIDVAEAMVRSGWAIDYTRYSKGHYAAAQTAARSERRGLWAGQFENPANWRRSHR